MKDRRTVSFQERGKVLNEGLAKAGIDRSHLSRSMRNVWMNSDSRNVRKNSASRDTPSVECYQASWAESSINAALGESVGSSPSPGPGQRSVSLELGQTLRDYNRLINQIKLFPDHIRQLGDRYKVDKPLRLLTDGRAPTIDSTTSSRKSILNQTTRMNLDTVYASSERIKGLTLTHADSFLEFNWILFDNRIN